MDENEIKNNEELEKEWADALHFDKWPPEPVDEQCPPAMPEEAIVHKPEPYNGMTSASPFNGGSVPPAPNPNVAFTVEEQPVMPSTYLVWSVLATVLCCFIPGIVAVIYSSKVTSRYYARDYEGSKKASEMAQYWIIGSIVLGLVVNTIYMPIMLCVGS